MTLRLSPKGLLAWALLSLAFFVSLCLSMGSDRMPSPLHLREVPLNTTGSADAPPRLRKATAADLEKARAIVNSALGEAAARNKARLDNPSRNKYTLKPGTQAGGSVVKRSGTKETESDAPPLLEITQEIADAAALLAEADAYAKANRSAPLPRIAKRAAYWMEDIARKGSWPFKNDDDYQVVLLRSHPELGRLFIGPVGDN